MAVSKRRPDVFCALLGKIIPSEIHHSVLTAYQAMPVPVATREPIPGQIASPEATEAIAATVVTLVPDEGWL